MRTVTAALVLAGTTVLAVPAPALAAPHAPQQTTCKNDGHKYIDGQTAKAHGKQTTFVGVLKRFHPCGEDDGYFTGKKAVTLTLTSASVIKVFKDQLDPSATKTVTAAKFPHAFKKRMDEPIYRFSGPAPGVKKLSEHFVS